MKSQATITIGDSLIAQIKGEIIEKNVDTAVIDVAGVGYELFLSTTSLSRIPSVGGSTTVFTYLHVREDNLQLYGFSSLEEKNLFQKLISVSGIGPKVALAVLSAYPPDSFKKAILSEDEELISSIPRIGKKSAKRIILELKEKLDLPSLGADTYGSALVEAREALISLGYSLNQAQKALENKGNGDLSAETLVKQALKKLGQPA